MQNEFIDVPSNDLPIATKEEVKFMQLLNEYLLKYYAEHGNKNLYVELGGWSVFNVHETVIISKKFGFIKWLVDNEKIDKDKIKLLSVFQETWYYNLYQSLLMILSIQEKPIEFLISILK